MGTNINEQWTPRLLFKEIQKAKISEKIKLPRSVYCFVSYNSGTIIKARNSCLFSLDQVANLTDTF